MGNVSQSKALAEDGISDLFFKIENNPQGDIKIN